MRQLMVLTLLVGIQGQGTGKSDCAVGDWGAWSQWVTASHDSSVSSYPIPEKTGEGTRMRQQLMQMRQDQKNALLTCREEGTCPLLMERESEGRVDCINGYANDLECWNVDQMSHVNASDMFHNPNVTQEPLCNDNWGWTDPDNGDEYALIGMHPGTTFIRITDPENPVVLGHIDTRAGIIDNIWRDLKVIDHYVYIVSEEADHGIQIFDLHRLRGVTSPVRFGPDLHYNEVGNCHNIVSNVDTGYFYAVGCTNGNYPNLCDGGLHVINVQDPLNPTFEGCFGGDGYVHDAQCVVYRGPDVTYYDREICFCYNADDFAVVDVTDKNNMTLISRSVYNGYMYTHQGWLTEDHTIVLMDDELDEIDTTDKITKTYIWDVQDLNNPILMNTYRAHVEAIDHNQYVKGNYVYQANNRVGLQILSIDQENYNLTLVGYFDAFPGANTAEFLGAWNAYPYFNSGNILLSMGEYGLFTVHPDYSALERAAQDGGIYTERRRYRELLAAEYDNDCPRLVEVERVK